MTGVLTGLNAATSLLNMPFSIADWFQANEAAEEQNRFRREAIGDAEAGAKNYRRFMDENNQNYYDEMEQRNRSTMMTQGQNLGRWFDNLQERGGYRGQLDKQQWNYLQQMKDNVYTPEWQRALQANYDVGAAAEGDIAKYQQEGQGLRGDIQADAELARGRIADLDKRLANARETMNLDEIRQSNREREGELTQQRGQFEIQSQMSLLDSQQQQAEMALEQQMQSGQITPQAYAAQKQQIADSFTRQKSDKSREIASEATRNALDMSLAGDQLLTEAKSSLNNTFNELYATDASLINSLQGFANAITGSMGDEMAFVANMRGTQATTAQSVAGMTSAASSSIGNLIIQNARDMAGALNSDEAALEFAQVSGPNQYLENYTGTMNATTTNYLANAQAAVQLGAQFDLTAIAGKGNFNPAFAALGDVTSNMMGAFNNAFDMELARRQHGHQVHAQNQAIAQGWMAGGANIMNTGLQGFGANGLGWTPFASKPNNPVT
jgi:hypothetical protein